MACRYGDIGLGVGILLIFSFVYMNLDVNLCCWILVYWMSIMCGFLCSLCVSS